MLSRHYRSIVEAFDQANKLQISIKLILIGCWVDLVCTPQAKRLALDKYGHRPKLFLVLNLRLKLRVRRQLQLLQACFAVIGLLPRHVVRIRRCVMTARRPETGSIAIRTN